MMFWTQPEDRAGTWLVTMILAAAFVAAVASQCACAPAKLTPEETKDVAALAVVLTHCQDVGRDAGTYAAYEGCKKDAGIK